MKIFALTLPRSSIMLFAFAAVIPLRSDVITDGSIGPAQTLVGPDFIIGQELGLRVGENLFHSFDTFTLDQTQSATFTGSEGIANVISRVTGGEVSTIDGVLRSTVEGAGFYFFNPSGVVFGPNAVVDVPASLHISTADELRLKDGSIFSAADPDVSTLGVARPEAFGFLNTQPAKLTINGSTLVFSSSGDVSFSGADIEIGNQAYVGKENGSLTLSAVGAQKAEVRIDTQNALEATGSFELTGGSIVSAYTNSEATPAELTIRTGDLLIDGRGSSSYTEIEAFSNAASGKGGSINISASGRLSILDGAIFGGTLHNGDGGDIAISAHDLHIEGTDSKSFVGITNQTFQNSGGSAGGIELSIGNLLELKNGGKVLNATTSAGDAGAIAVDAGEILIDRNGANGVTGILNEASQDSAGSAGSISVSTDGQLSIVNGAEVSSSTWSTGNAGTLSVQAGEIWIEGGDASVFTGIASAAFSDLTDAGNSGDIAIATDGVLSVVNGAKILSTTWSAGDAGTIAIDAAQMVIDGQNAAVETGISSVSELDAGGNAGKIDVAVADLLKMTNGAMITSSTFSSGDAGALNVHAGEIEIDDMGAERFTGIASAAYGGSADSGNAGNVAITADTQLNIMDGAQISSSAWSTGDAGEITIQAGDIFIDNKGHYRLTGITSATYGEMADAGDAGKIGITADGKLTVLNGAQISCETWSSGNAGEINVNAGAILIDGEGLDAPTGILNGTAFFSRGNAGTINVATDGLLEMINGGTISSSTYSVGDAGAVNVYAQTLRIDAQGENVTEISSTANQNSSGNAGSINVNVTDLLEILEGASINSDTWSVGDAGEVSIHAGKVLLDTHGFTQWSTGIGSSASVNSGGNAGSVKIVTDSLLAVVNGAQIQSSAFSSGNAGEISIEARKALIDGEGAATATTISSSAEPGSGGHAGKVDFTVQGLLKIVDGGSISSSTWGAGDAGEITIRAGDMIIDGKTSYWNTGIASFASADATGLAGDISIHTGNLKLSNTGGISIDHTGNASGTALSDFEAGQLAIEADNIDMKHAASITAVSRGNVPASSISITTNGHLSVTQSSTISTEANSNDGGPISIRSDSVCLNNGVITTSTAGGNGGDITVSSDVLLMDTGFIQANTAQGVSGGDIAVDTSYLITKKSLLPEIGGSVQEEFLADSGRNIIQAAAPQGNPGNLQITVPDIDIVNTLAQLSTRYAQTTDLIKDPCTSGTRNSSSLVEIGRGGVPPGTDEPATIFFGAKRLEHLLKNAERQ